MILTAKGKAIPVYTIKAHGGIRGTAPFIHNLGIRRGWVINAMTLPLYPQEKPYTHSTAGRLGLGASLDSTQKLAPTGVQIPDYPVHSESLYRLNYPGCQFC